MPNAAWTEANNVINASLYKWIKAAADYPEVDFMMADQIDPLLDSFANAHQLEPAEPVNLTAEQANFYFTLIINQEALLYFKAAIFIKFYPELLPPPPPEFKELIDDIRSRIV